MRKFLRICALALAASIALLFTACSDDGKTVMLGKQSAHTHCICGGRNTNLGHTSHSDVTFQPWRETDKLPTTGNYYLTRNVTLTKKCHSAKRQRLSERLYRDAFRCWTHYVIWHHAIDGL